MKTLKIVGISGSIRKGSSSHIVLEELARFLGPEIEYSEYNNLAGIPAFDGRDEEPDSVKQFKEIIKEADGVAICTPEYAWGVPGALKNALDWTVGTSDFVHKPVALITASSHGERGHESLLHTLTAISANLHHSTNLLISFIRAKTKDGRISDQETLNIIQRLTQSFIEIVKANQTISENS